MLNEGTLIGYSTVISLSLAVTIERWQDTFLPLICLDMKQIWSRGPLLLSKIFSAWHRKD